MDSPKGVAGTIIEAEAMEQGQKRSGLRLHTPAQTRKGLSICAEARRNPLRTTPLRRRLFSGKLLPDNHTLFSGKLQVFFSRDHNYAGLQTSSTTM